MTRTQIALLKNMTPKQVKKVETTAITKLTKLLNASKKEVVKMLKDLAKFEKQSRVSGKNYMVGCFCK